MPLLPNQNEVAVHISTHADNKGIDQAESRVRSFAGNITGAATAIVAGFAGVGAAVAGVGLSAIKMAADMEQSQIAFATLLKDGDKAKTFLEDLKSFAARTPFELQGIQDSSRKLLAMGFSAEEVLPIVTDIGDATAALGGNATMIDAVTRALSQMKAKGVASAEEMSQQLAEQGIPAWEFLAKKIGTDVPTAMALVEKRAIDANTAIDAIREGIQDRFGGSMEKQSKTIAGMFSTLKDEFKFFMMDIGKAITDNFDVAGLIEKATAGLKAFAGVVKNDVIPFLKNNPELVKAFAIGLGTTLVVALGVVTAAFIAANIAALPWIALIVAIGAAVGALYYAWQTNFLGIQEIVQGVVTFFTDTVIPAVQGFVEDMGNKINWLKENWAQALGWVVGFFMTLPFKLSMYMGLAIAGIVQNIVAIDWSKVWDNISSAFMTAMDWIGNAWNTLWEKLKNFDYGGFFSGVGKSIGNALVGMIEGAIQGALSGVPGAGSIKLPRFADGVTNFKGGMALVGERGPELVRLPRGSDVIPNNQLQRGATINQTNHIYNQVDLDASLREIGWRLNS